MSRQPSIETIETIEKLETIEKPRSPEAGMTLIELSVAMGILAVIFAVFLSVLATATRKTQPLQHQAQTVDELRIALSAIARELRSAQCVALPVANGATSSTLRFTSFFGGGSDAYEVTYTATGGQLLRQVTGETAVRMVSSSLVSTADAFQHMATPRRTIRIRFHVQSDPTKASRELSTTVAGRNAWKVC
jgi:prepilin-type N-terminal cleavage/methylation domain-containing protein